MFITLDHHCAAVSHVLESMEDGNDWHTVCDWLMIAASVGSVEINTAKYSLGYGWCSSADEFHDAREELLGRFVEDYSVFSFVWGALEATLNIVKPPKNADRSKRGKVRDASCLLKLEFESRPAVAGLIEEVQRFREAAQDCLGFDAVNSRFAEVGELGAAGVGLYAVYELRNQFAHGSLAFPMPDEENRPISQHESMVEHATRVVLLELQMLLLAHFKKSDEPVSFSWHPGSISEEVPLWLALRVCHLERGNADFQLSLLQDA